MMNKQLKMTDRTRVRRKPDRAQYAVDEIYKVIDDAFIGAIAFHDGGSVHAIPTAIWRENDRLFIHGSNGSRLLKTLKEGAQVCVSITEIDGLVMARSAVAHSMNFRSVCIYGVFTAIEDSAAKNAALKYFLEHWMPGRWQYVREPSQQELAAVTVLSIPITEAVLKSRQGPPTDYPHDVEQQVWAGVAPLQRAGLPLEQVKEQNHADLPGKSVRWKLKR